MMEARRTSEMLVNVNQLHGATTHKAAIFIFTAVKTSNHTQLTCVTKERGGYIITQVKIHMMGTGHIISSGQPESVCQGRNEMRTEFRAESPTKLTNWEKKKIIRGKPEDGNLGCVRRRQKHCLSVVSDVRAGLELRLLISEPMMWQWWKWRTGLWRRVDLQADTVPGKHNVSTFKA
jgi:hypothetical protein